MQNTISSYNDHFIYKEMFDAVSYYNSKYL